MARSIRSESDANTAMYLATLQPKRDDWRAILAKREQKRTARHYRQARRTQAGFLRIAVALLLVIVGAVAFMAWDAAARAVVALTSVRA